MPNSGVRIKKLDFSRSRYFKKIKTFRLVENSTFFPVYDAPNNRGTAGPADVSLRQSRPARSPVHPRPPLSYTSSTPGVRPQCRTSQSPSPTKRCAPRVAYSSIPDRNAPKASQFLGCKSRTWWKKTPPGRQRRQRRQ